MLLPLQGAWIRLWIATQGVTLGYVLLGFQPVKLPKNDSLPNGIHFKSIRASASKHHSKYRMSPF